jgi:choline dehydrogenase
MRNYRMKKLDVKVKSAVLDVGKNMENHNAMVVVYGNTRTLVGDPRFATLVTAQDVLGNKTATMAASPRNQISAWVQATFKYTCEAIHAKAYDKRFQVQHDLIFKQNVTIAELYQNSLGGAIVSQL